MLECSLGNSAGKKGLAMFTSMTIKGRPVLGGFGKGLPGSITLNFGTSGGSNCDTECAYHPRSTNSRASSADARCYAAACENRRDRTQLLAKLQRHESTDAVSLIDAATNELTANGWRAPWFRFSAFGSVPMQVPANFPAFVSRIRAAGIPIHLPIESASKANTYRMALQGIDIAVRESVTNVNRWLIATTPVSIVAGSMQDSPRERIVIAKSMAAIRTRNTGRKVVVCPAVAAMHLRTKSDRAKCGACTACANPSLDIVYPVHK